jgi:hypothetical protein
VCVENKNKKRVKTVAGKRTWLWKPPVKTGYSQDQKPRFLSSNLRNMVWE